MLLSVSRKAMIKDLILEKKSVTVIELAKLFSVTEETIRHDLRTLEQQGFLTRTYGGAYIQDGVLNDINIKVRETTYVSNKEQIASQCVSFINHGDSIFLDASTTSLFIAKKIKDKRITVLTNSLKAAETLSESQSVRLILTGGTLASQSMSLLGRYALVGMKEIFFDKAFISCRSLCMENGITDSNEQQAEVRSLAVKRSKKVFLVADHTKFDNTSFAYICGFNDIDVVVTDETLTETWHEFLNKNNVEIIESN